MVDLHVEKGVVRTEIHAEKDISIVEELGNGIASLLSEFKTKLKQVSPATADAVYQEFVRTVLTQVEKNTRQSHTKPDKTYAS